MNIIKNICKYCKFENVFESVVVDHLKTVHSAPLPRPYTDYTKRMVIGKHPTKLEKWHAMIYNKRSELCEEGTANMNGTRTQLQVEALSWVLEQKP